MWYIKKVMTKDWLVATIDTRVEPDWKYYYLHHVTWEPFEMTEKEIDIAEENRATDKPIERKPIKKVVKKKTTKKTTKKKVVRKKK